MALGCAGLTFAQDAQQQTTKTTVEPNGNVKQKTKTHDVTGTHKTKTKVKTHHNKTKVKVKQQQ